MKLPTGWKLQRIEEVADVKGGKRLPKGYSLVTENTGFPYIRVTDMKNGTVDERGVMYIPVDVAPRISRYIINKGDVFISVAGNLGVTGIIPESLDGANLTENADKLTNLKINQKFLFEVLRSPIIQNRVEAEKTQNAQPKLALTRIKSFEIPVPPLPEQKKVAQIFSAWDKAINATEQLLANSQQQKKALMQQLLTGKKRLLDENGVRFSREWAEIKLSDLCLKITDGAHNSPPSVLEGYPIYSVKDMTSSGFSNDDVRIIGVSDYQLLSKQGCKPAKGDVLIAKDGSVLKHCFVVDDDLEAVVLSSIAILKPNPDLIASDFLAQYFSQEHFKFFVKKALTSGSGVPRIVLKDFKGIFFKVPSISEQLKIVSVLAVADQEISALQQKLDALQQEKKALMQQLLTGKRRVKVQ